MRTKFILSFFRVSVTILFYLLIFFSLFFLATSIITISQGNKTQAAAMVSKSYKYEVKGFGRNIEEAPVVYSQDSLVGYRPLKDRFTVQIEPDSTMGYYALVMKLVFMALGISILWNFRKIFKELDLERPFTSIIVKRLTILAALFIISDVVKFIDYLLFNSFLHQSITSPQLKLITEAGNGIITGLIILIIAVIYQKGNSLQEENALTV